MPTKTDPDPSRQRAAYRYRDENLVVLHTTSAPFNDEAALEYVQKVNNWHSHHGSTVKFVEYRDWLSGKFIFMKITIEDGVILELQKEDA